VAKRYELSDAQWARIAELLPGKQGDRGRTAKDNRIFVDGVLWMLRSGARWSDRSVCSGNPVLCPRKYGVVGCLRRCEQLLVATRSSFSKGAF
jgi:transposase